jgi:hypothetical protein
LGNSRRDSEEVVSFAQLSVGWQEQTDIEAVRSSEGSRASFLCAETQRCTRVRIAMHAMRPSS